MRVVGRAWPGYETWTRICVGDDWEMDRCEAALADTIVSTLIQTARTGNKGDGLVTIKDVARAIRIRTGETAGQAL